ncbi:MAG: hypothetical protein CL623_11565 [Arcobacter sp.]|nr:hypothetical protein [Arcobacter sp.]
MKTLFLFTLTLILTFNLNARENPFEATNAYEEEVARIIEQNEIDENSINEAAYIQEMQEKMSNITENNQNKNKVEEAIKKLTPALKTEKTYTQKEVKKLIKKAQVQSESKVKKLVKKELEKNKPQKLEQIVYVKPRTDIIEENTQTKTKVLLNFIKVEYNDNKLILHTKDLVSKKFNIDKENKLIIDYKARKNFYTKRENLDSKNFKKIAVGNHKEEKFYRVVILLSKNSSNYKVEYKDNIITVLSLN